MYFSIIGENGLAINDVTQRKRVMSFYRLVRYRSDRPHRRSEVEPTPIYDFFLVEKIVGGEGYVVGNGLRHVQWRR